MSDKPNCYKCKHRRPIAFDCHSSCAHPDVHGRDPVGTLGIKGNPYGKSNGWFMWPLNFDPVWLEECDGFDGAEVSNV